MTRHFGVRHHAGAWHDAYVAMLAALVYNTDRLRIQWGVLPGGQIRTLDHWH